ncbi:MAG: hypothetical protein Q9187_002126 [Circinaria calcarea]
MVGYDLHEEMTTNSTGHMRVLRTLLTSNLPALQPALQRSIAQAFAAELIGLQNFCAGNPEFWNAALRYPQDVFRTGEALRFTPSLLSPLVALIFTGGNPASKTLLKYLIPVVHDRLRQRTSQGMEHKNRPSLTYALYDLCLHPQYIDPLRKELSTVLANGSDWQPENLPLLDSFIKESARLNPSDSISVRRKALTSYTFSDGTQVSPGSWVCVPQRSIMRDPKNYPSPMIFDGFRFAPEISGKNTHALARFTDTGAVFPIWGAGKRVWSVCYRSAYLQISVVYGKC